MIKTRIFSKKFGMAMAACACLGTALYHVAPATAESIIPPKQVAFVAPKPLSTTKLKGVIFTDPTSLRKNFPLSETIDRILISSGDMASTDSAAVKKTKREAFLQTLMTSFKRTSATNKGVTMPLTPRPEEAAQKPSVLLNPADNFNGMQPIAVTNRLDLAPADGKHCGEQRIIYAKGPGTFDNRMTLIFEAVVPNPTPAKGILGCMPLAKFWWNLQNVTVADMGTQLKGLFYTGVPGVTSGPIVHFKNYGTPLGQVRVNSFVVSQNRGNPWVLREYGIRKKTGKAAYLSIRPIGNSPLSLLYKAPVKGENAKITQLRKDYQAFLLGQAMTDLLAIDIAAVKSKLTVTDHDMINRMGTTIPTRFNGFEDLVDSAVFEPGRIISQPLDRAISDKIRTTTTAWPVNPFDFIGRVTIQSCAGCHEFTNGRPIQENVVWPRSLGFVHIDEEGQVSELLKDRFLPFRYKSMSDFIKNNAAPNIPPPPTRERALAMSNQAAVLSKIASPSVSDAETEDLVSTQREAEDALIGAFIEHRPTH